MAKLKATRRGGIGTRKARRLRAEGEIPGIIYGHGLEPAPVTLNEHDLGAVIQRSERLLEIDLDGTTENVLIKEVQYDTFGQEILHVDLSRVSLDERVEVTVPIVLRGTPAGAAEGGVLQKVAPEVTLECPVMAIPEEIRVSVVEMKIDDVMHMRDLPLPEGAKLTEDPDAVVCNISIVEEEVAEEPVEEGGPEPEVIGEKKEEGEGETQPEKPEKSEKKEK